MNTPIPASFRTLDLNLLRVFDEVMAERSLTRAARHLALLMRHGLVQRELRGQSAWYRCADASVSRHESGSARGDDSTFHRH